MKWLWSKLRLAVLLSLLLLAISAFLPPSTGLRSTSQGSSAKNDVVQIINAVRNYRVDYGYLPKVTDNGFCETAQSNARLIKILTGEDSKENPRRIRFLEVPKGREKRGVYRSGIHPETGAWVDPWGNFYRIRIATDELRIPNPYPHDEPRFLEAKCIAWSVGADGKQDQKLRALKKKGNDDMTSWDPPQ